MQKKRIGLLLVLLGVLLVAAAAFLLFHNSREDVEAGSAAGEALSRVEAVISSRIEALDPDKKGGSTEVPLSPELPTVTIDGYDYIGCLELPVLSIRLPVMSEWDYDRLKIAPCRQFGSSRTDDLVIAAHNYTAHFGRLGEMSVGDLVTFTDTDGLVNTYVVRVIDRLAPSEVERVENSGYDLVLYTCNYDSSVRITLFCSRTEPSEDAAPLPEAE